MSKNVRSYLFPGVKLAVVAILSSVILIDLSNILQSSGRLFASLRSMRRTGNEDMNWSKILGKCLWWLKVGRKYEINIFEFNQSIGYVCIIFLSLTNSRA